MRVNCSDPPAGLRGFVPEGAGKISAASHSPVCVCVCVCVSVDEVGYLLDTSKDRTLVF